jgi:alpha-beta hydrolase superfamily lysophospholipase
MSREECKRLDQADVLRILFHPRRDNTPDDEQTVRFSVADDIEIGGRFHPADKDAPVILLFHGNGEIASDYDMIAPFYLENGISLLVVDYRGYGKSGGRPTVSTLLDDALAVYRQTGKGLADHGYQYSRLFVMGRSLGSAAALEIAAEAGKSISGLIIESGFSNPLALINRLGGPSLKELEETCGFDNLKKIERVEAPTLIIHGEEDFIIPLEEGEALFKGCKAKRKEFLSGLLSRAFTEGRGLCP